ncbi:MAG: polysaccharide pyruvyl transferase family protein [Clostridia bacterium]
MKVGILTHYNVNNQGAQLQMYALTNFLKQNGYDIDILTYKKNYDFDLSKGKRNQISLRSIPYVFKEFLIKKGLFLTVFNTKKYLKNKKFRKQNFNFKFYNNSDLSAIVIGSDEVLSLELGCNFMMYGHGCLANNIIYYAPSFGQTDITRIEKYNYLDLIKSGVEKVNYLSGRDANTCSILEKLSGEEVKIVCDPVLLYDFSQTSTKIKKINKKYMILYGYDKNFNDEKEIFEVKKFAKEKGYKIISVGTYHKWCDVNITCNCLEWLEYFKYAEFIITDTFHGTIASLINNKPLIVKTRSINNNKLEGILNQFEIGYIEIDEITKENIETIYNNNINYTMFNEKLEIIRKNSSQYLLGALKNECK